MTRIHILVKKARPKSPPRPTPFRFVAWLISATLAVVLAIGIGFWAWTQHAVTLSAPTVEVSIDPGSSAKEVAQTLVQAGVQVNPTLLYAWFRLSGHARALKAGSYELALGATPQSLLQKLVRGEESLRTVTLVEGWSFRQVRQALAKAEQLKPDTQPLEDEDIMVRLGRPQLHPEGRFFPDTYAYAKGSSDLEVLRRAMKAMDRRLGTAWQARNPAIALKTPEEALILASIVEKETGQPSDRAEISAVFHNRLRLGMMLQTDPTVIYGMGTRFDGNLRKNDLRQDTPWNTYTRVGLPPTPIAMPGKAALLAAVQPKASPALYFVARGDGSSAFSASLEEHNRAVNRYQRGRP